MAKPQENLSASWAQFADWYRTPVGLLFGTALTIALVLALTDHLAAAFSIQIIAVGLVIPWKMARVRQEAHQNAAVAAAAHAATLERFERTPTKRGLNSKLKSVRVDLEAQLSMVEHVHRDRETTQVVIGLGTGRSGTVSLSRLLDDQPSASVDHELRPHLPWEFDLDELNARFSQLEKNHARLIGDVGFYYLPYVREIAKQLPNCKFVCMRREREATIDSLMRKTGNDNLWADHDGTEWTLNPVWDPTMPSYPAMPKREAIARYWDEYNAEALVLSEELGDQFEIFDVEKTFHDADMIGRLLDHVGVDRDAQNVVVDIHLNARPEES